MGAHSALDHSKPNYLDQVLALTDERGVDVIIEMLANVNLEKDFQALAKYGRIVIVGSRGSHDFNPRLTMMKEADVLGMAVWNTTQQEYVSSSQRSSCGFGIGSSAPDRWS